MNCPLCHEQGGIPVWSDEDWRVIRAPDEDHPAFYRLIARRHVAEFSELGDEERRRCMALLCAIERELIARLQPRKINLAALGNMVPHLHWHVIARFEWDSHFPQAVWGARQREVDGGALARLALDPEALDRVIAAALDAEGRTAA